MTLQALGTVELLGLFVVGGWLATAVARLRFLLSPCNVVWQVEFAEEMQLLLEQRRAPMQTFQVFLLVRALLAALIESLVRDKRVPQLLVLQEAASTG